MVKVIACALVMSARLALIEDTYISEEIQSYCIEAGAEYGICPELIMAMVEKESSGNPLAENGDCKGLMQVDVRYHKDRMEELGVDNIFDARGNIYVAVDYLAELAEEYGDVGLVLDKYNGNSKAMVHYENGTQSKYSKWILDRASDLERKHGK